MRPEQIKNSNYNIKIRIAKNKNISKEILNYLAKKKVF